jgi:hypothetical protein
LLMAFSRNEVFYSLRVIFSMHCLSSGQNTPATALL